MYVSEDILKEYEEILKEHAAPGQMNLCWKFSQKAQTSYLVTNDRHFDVVKDLPFPKVKILPSEEFLEILRASNQMS